MSEIALGILLLTGLVLALTVMVMLARSVLMPSRPAHVTVNGRTELATTTGTKLLGVLNDAGILVPSACGGAGTCG
ncbi:MAG: NADH:ubiquinone reductase (Na(+)-transporting) subunit F, partial [Rhodobacteraceae bacterium]|nr:NADH:ubiquinone reductase (Na(+)-transporting) subunit F [Paracoccaceae bacterium]